MPPCELPFVKNNNSKMRTRIEMDLELADAIAKAQRATGQARSTIIRAALRVGLSEILNHDSTRRPEGFFASDYLRNVRVEFESAVAHSVIQKPERR
jgi:metal-responsive CopG/Arc/MetJ family transcriptional regulator